MSSVTTGSGSQTRKKEDGYSQVLQQPRTELAGKTPLCYTEYPALLLPPHRPQQKPEWWMP